MSDIIIIAPHPDDEIIGCYGVLEKYHNERKIAVIYGPDCENERKEEMTKLKNYYSCHQAVQNIVPQYLVQKENTFFFPDPVNEIHPDHRKWGIIGEDLARRGLDVIFYTIQMNVPYIHKINDPNNKESILNDVYPSQKSLWEYEKKYILFEGYCKWIF